MEMLTSLMHDQTLRDQVVSMVQFEFLQSLGLQEQADSHPQVGVLIFMYMIYGMLVLAFYSLVTTAWYIDMAWWTTFFFPFFSISYLAYWVFAINDLDKAKAILKNVEVWDDEYENQRGKDNKRSRRQDDNKPTLWDWMFSVHVKFAEVATMPFAAVTMVFGYNLW